MSVRGMARRAIEKDRKAKADYLRSFPIVVVVNTPAGQLVLEREWEGEAR